MTETLPMVQRSICPVAINDKESAGVQMLYWAGAWRPERGPIELARLPTPEHRQVLVERQRDLVTALTKFDRREVGAAVGEMLTCYSKYQLVKPSADDKKAFQETVTKFVKELQKIPTWACVRACAAIRDGVAPDISLKFPPSTIEVKTLAESYLQPIKTELVAIGEILGAVKAAPVVTDEQRKEVAAKLKTFGEELRAREKVRNQEDEEIRLAYQRQFAAAHERFITREYGAAAVVECAPGMLLSKSLVDKLAEPRPNEWRERE